jgi:hypothetical protein
VAKRTSLPQPETICGLSLNSTPAPVVAAVTIYIALLCGIRALNAPITVVAGTSTIVNDVEEIRPE